MEMEVVTLINYNNLYWWSDWDYSDLGFDGEGVIGLYQLKDYPEVKMYIDNDKNKILDVWLDNDK